MIEFTARNERWVVLAGLFLVVVLGLAATVKSGDMLMSWRDTHTPAYAFMLFIMWWTMMLAMMLPSAAPAILTFGTLSRKILGKGCCSCSHLGFHDRVPGDLDGIQRCSSGPSASHPGSRSAHGHDGGHELRHRWRPPDCGRPLPGLPIQVCLPPEVSVPPHVLRPELAERLRGCIPDGVRTWCRIALGAAGS